MSSSSISFSPNYGSVYKSLLDPDDCPKVHFHHIDGGHMERGSLLSPNLRKSGKPDAFLMIPVSITQVEGDEQLSWRRDEDDELSALRYAGYVAIAIRGDDETKTKGNLRYLSCRRKVPGMGSALAEYRSEIGRYEVFQLEYSFHARAFSFKSHNELYLHHNAVLKTVAFKPVTATQAKWRISDVEKMQKRPVRNSKHLLYAGVVNLQREAGKMEVFGESILDETSFDRGHFEFVLDLLRQEGASTAKKCTIFQLSDVGQQWFVTTDEDCTAAVVIASLQYPSYLAVECIDDVAALFDFKYKSLFVEGKSPSEAERERMAKEIYATHMEYEEAIDNGSSTESLDADLGEVQARMAQNIDNLLSNMESGESLLSKTDDLLKDAEIFKKRAKKLKTKTKLVMPALFAVVGGAAGGIGGWLMGGPVGAAYLGSQVAEIGVGIGAGVAGCSILHSCARRVSPFWGNRFVYVSRSLVKKSSTRALQVDADT